MGADSASSQVYELSNGSYAFRFGAALELVEEGERAWIHCAPYGHWEGHPNGPFTFNDSTFDSIIAEFRKNETPPNVDYEHESLNPNLPGAKPAAGWIHDLKVRANGLWALIEFTKRCAEYVKAGEYKFVSPALDFKSKDRKSGKSMGPSLRNIAVTNMPFLDALVPMQLTRIEMANTIKTTKSETVEKPADVALNEETAMAEDAPVDGTAVIDAIAEAAGMGAAGVAAALIEKMEEIVAIISGAAEEDGSEAEADDAAGDMEASTVAASRVAAIAGSQITALSQQVASLTAEKDARDKAEIEAYVDSKIELTHVMPEQRDNAIWLCTEDRTKFDAIFSAAQVPLGVNQSTAAPLNGGTYKLSDLPRQEQLNAKAIMAGGRTEEFAIEKVIARRSVA